MLMRAFGGTSNAPRDITYELSQLQSTKQVTRPSLRKLWRKQNLLRRLEVEMKALPERNLMPLQIE